MGPAAFGLLISVAPLHRAPPPDTTTYADRATQQLVARAVARHAEQDTTVRDYNAKLRYRVSFGFARRKWGDPLPVAVEEQAATISWQLPNDLRVDMLGRRSVSQLQGVDLSSTFSHPWFVPRTLGDSLRIFGASQTPAQAAPHPLSQGAAAFYRYAAGDSLSVTSGGRRITIRSVTVTPRVAHGALVAGILWLDTGTGDVVRFTFRFVGTNLWTTPEGNTPHDSASARGASNFISKIVELGADLEYSLQGSRHWMPYREVIAGKVSMPFGVDFAVPFEATTTFSDYNINTGTQVVFDAPFPRDTNARGRNSGRFIAGGGRGGGARPLPDSLRARGDSLGLRNRFRNRTGFLAGGGRYEIHRPPPDSMRRYAGWGDSLKLSDNDTDRRRLQQGMADVARIADGLPRRMTGRPGVGFAWERVSDILRYNRVEGTTLSFGEHVPTPVSFTDLYGTLRYGFADHRVMGRIAAVRDAPGGQLVVAASRDLQDIDPFASGLTFGNSLRGIFTGHDDGAYLLAQGGRLSYETSRGPGTEMMLSALVEDEQSVSSRARAFIPRITGSPGYFPPTTPIREGTAAGAGVRLDHAGPAARWVIDLRGLLVSQRGAGQFAAQLRLNHLASHWLTARIAGGLALGSDSVPQLALRAGGINTVRGYDFGVEQGDALWSVQLDVSRPGRGTVKLVGFLDAGQAGNRSDFGNAAFLSGAGVGVSILGGFIRADLSHPLTSAPGRGVRFDLIFGGAR